MRLAWLVVLLTGCETMESSGNPFKPVEVRAPATAAPVDAEPFWDDEEPISISSEEMLSGADPLHHGESPVEATAPAPSPPAPVPTASTATAPAPAPSMAVAALAPTAPALPAPAHGASGWPVRLVRTLPETQPPRAILGMPDGSEIVVSPGSMVPSHGLVVVAIGRQSAQLARVSAMGDSAAIDQVTLTALY